ncbi:FtsX-like permease family protein [Dyadobacter sp. LHD-138]|uniref:ABC transporter permease n=1 Tax=Dyadobacter sp. LHD-138 TaxID=3071413 RepID=UPI0027E017A3|nr:FtsX-like permease family protein [Dyadobacter sp. LHD-138]MDQ6479282.1 FtsX-like permease family protein [Dyadobacter sp. LHD-138]
MIRNYFKISFRNLIKGGWYSALNIGGLAVVLAVSLLLFWWVKDELSFDNFHSDNERIYRINSHFGVKLNESTFSDTPAPVAVLAKKSVPGVEAVLRIADYDHGDFRVGDKIIAEKGRMAYSDENLLTFFDGLTVLHGDPKNPFPTPVSVLITRKLAEKFFGSSNVIGKIFTNVDDNQTFSVGAVIADNPDNASLRYQMYIPMQALKQSYKVQYNQQSMDDNWDDFGFESYVKLGVNTDPVEVEKQLTLTQNAARKTGEEVADYRLQPLRKLHLYSPDGKSSGMRQVKIFGLTALLLLAIGSINYVNLTTARATRRNKEVGIRKAVGAKSRQLAGQLLVESVITLSLSLVTALILIQILLPFYKNITGKTGHFSLLDFQSWVMLFGTLILTFLLAGIYPAVLISGYNPVNALRGRSGRRSSVGLRKGLVVAQFVLTTVLISSTFIIGRQLNYIRQRDSGFNREHVFSFDGKKSSALLKQTLLTQSGIKNVSTSSDTPIDVSHGTTTVAWDGSNNNQGLIFVHMSIDSAFIPNFGIRIVEGKNFDGSPSDSAHFILNEMALKLSGIKNPVGRRFKFERTEGTIIGVVKDFNIASAHERIRPLILYSIPAKNDMVHVQTTAILAESAVAAVEKIWKKYNPQTAFAYTFLSESYDKQYRGEQQTQQLFSFFAATAIMISCLGLLGLVGFTAEQRTKEIGIRKVLGAGVFGITALLSMDFLKLVLFAIFIAIPISWISMENWLANFAFKVSIEWWVFVVTGVMTVMTALLSISYQAIKAALMNPVKSLKSE